MRNVTVNGKTLPVDTRGETVLIYMDEFGRDILADAMMFLTGTTASRPNLSVTSKIMYSYIKTANNDIYKNYHIFMNSMKNAKAFLDKDNVLALVEETYDLLGVEKESDDAKKEKKRTENAQTTE